ncbi:helix-turn-helix domain-containing protein [Yinghuangia sp. ASG 101]|uniref:helix-turn-helix domain-containing protein n=1 Tax=Yinghuangia sp. ASG 101 TaxID=2896848 RepID=UPI001E50B8D6|nr:helix-turn-helix transcriptional regulator [Yinghuangia sp. ASG 101]UGQ11281.1 helix-turn-helix domain-containing protein [Yinghuangia sp. ASG 101]
MFKLAREDASLSQERLAEQVRVDKATVQGWESGRRPIAAVQTSRLMALRKHLLRNGTDPALLATLDDAMEADAVIGHALTHRPDVTNIDQHPLGSWVFTRATTHMIAWAVNGSTPAALTKTPRQSALRRGPVPLGPILPAAEKSALFSHLREAAAVAQRVGEQGALLRRQALYLCSYDTAADTHAWLADMQARHPRRTARSAPEWAGTRSVATSLTRYGDRDALHAFIQACADDETHEAANLAYWAYWLGLDALPRADDSFMSAHRSDSWDGLSLLRRLADRLDPGLACIDLNIHSVWALIALRKSVLHADHDFLAELGHRVDKLVDSSSISARARRELESVHYVLRASAR